MTQLLAKTRTRHAALIAEGEDPMAASFIAIDDQAIDHDLDHETICELETQWGYELWDD